ncbi:MAG: exosome complex protein Rrp42, partial [Candidatus Rokuibacteriota bacterium]
LVNLGGTTVLVGVKVALGTPFPDRPKDGVIITNAELVPMASPSFEVGPPSKESIEVARVVDRSIRESKMLDLGELCVKEGEKVWMLNIDIHAINYDGNLFDAALIAAVTALKLTKVPAKDKGVGPENVPLHVHHTPTSTTAIKIGRNIFIDPQIDEESVAEARLTVGVDEHGAIRAMQKGLDGSFTVDEVKYIIRVGQQIAHETREAIHKATK